MGLEFFEEGHRYELDGEMIPSVSRIIEPMSTKAYDSIPEYVLMRAAAKGSAVHEAIENYNLFGEIDIPSEYSGYMDAYTLWFETFNPEVVRCELPTWHKFMRYAGTVDMLCKINDQLFLVDFKTSTKLIDKTYRLQLEAYRQALRSQGIEVEQKYVLHLKANGVFEFVPYELDDKEAWAVFSGLKAFYDYSMKE